jgi:glycosyltransferase
VVYLFQLHIKDRQNLVFQLNFTQEKLLTQSLKAYFVCKIVSVIHYSAWASHVFGNRGIIQNILAKSEENITSSEKSLYRSFQHEQSLLQASDTVVCISDYMRHWLIEDYKMDESGIVVVPNGLKDSYKERNKIGLRQKWRLPENELLLLFAGRLDEIKGLGELLKAFRILLQSQPCRLLVAGDGAYNVFMKESKDICTHVTYSGMLDQSELFEWYQMADVGVMPSLYEPFGYVAVEMMMFELPIVVTATSGLNEIVEDGISGLKIPIMEIEDKVEIDVKTLVDKILFLLKNPDERKRIGKNGRRRYEQNYTSEIFQRNMLKVYESVIQKS